MYLVVSFLFCLCMYLTITLSVCVLLKVRKLYHVIRVNQPQGACSIEDMKGETIVVIDNVRSAHNVGSIFRTSDGAGVSQIILGGYTPAPIDRFGREVDEIKKTSLGASSMIPWEQCEADALPTRLLELKEKGFTVVALEQTDTSVSLYDFEVPSKVVYIVGNEIDGVRPELLTVTDTVVEIPMQGRKESLNVSVATGILLFHR